MLLPSLPDEFEGIDLPDARLADRLKLIASAVERCPGEAFPVAFGRVAELEGSYRFFNNERVDATRLFTSHFGATAARCHRERDVVVVHDTSEFAFSGEREGLYALSSKRRGFCGHFSIALSADGQRRPLGALAYSTVRRVEKDPEATWLDRFKDPEKESLRWFKGVQSSAVHLGSGARAVHVMDREGDSWELFEKLLADNHLFVVRLAQDRAIPDNRRVSDALAEAEVVLERDVSLSERRDHEERPTAAKKKHPAREERLARLGISAIPLDIRRPRHIHEGPPSLAVHVVCVREIDPPEGVEPVEWRLVTNLPIGGIDQIAFVVDAYRARWVIEEFFKALKTGCSFLKRQAESLAVLERILAVYTPAAWRLLLLRWVSRHAPDAPAESVVTPVQLQCLRYAAKRTRFSERPTAREAALAVAELGGHIANNGEPGWLVLGRGMDRLAEREMGWLDALQALAEGRLKLPAAGEPEM
jgi:hypothetical protein